MCHSTNSIRNSNNSIRLCSKVNQFKTQFITMKKILFLLMLTIFGHDLWAQSEVDAVRSSIEQMFNGMRKGDSAMVHQVFADDAQMQTILNIPSGEAQVRNGDLQSFLNAVGTPHDEVWDERILDYQIKIDGSMASAWTPYEFYRGDTFSHCGVNSFQLAKLEGKWRVIYIVDTRRREGCK